MKKYGTFLFYLVALAAVSYFLRQYLHAPREFIISLIISLAIIARIARQKKSYLPIIGTILLIGHMIRLIWLFIPVYNHQPDIRQWYRKSPTTIRSLPGASSGVNLLLEHAGKNTMPSSIQLRAGKPLYQGDRISVAGPSLSFTDRLVVSLRDGSYVQVLPQSSFIFDMLSPDYARLTGSRVGIILEGGVISIATRRKEFAPTQRYVKAGNIFFSCRTCLITLSGTAGNIVSETTFMWRTNSGEILSISGGVYSFSRNSISAATNPTLLSLFIDSTTPLSSWRNEYDAQRKNFITSQRGRPLETSTMLQSISKIKMSLAGIANRTYLDKRNHLLLYEYLRESTELFPSAFASQQYLYEFIQ